MVPLETCRSLLAVRQYEDCRLALRECELPLYGIGANRQRDAALQHHALSAAFRLGRGAGAVASKLAKHRHGAGVIVPRLIVTAHFHASGRARDDAVKLRGLGGIRIGLAILVTIVNGHEVNNLHAAPVRSEGGSRMLVSCK